MKHLADIPLVNGGLKGLAKTGPLSNITGSGIINLSTFLSSVIGIMTIVAIIWFVIIFFTGAIGIISSGGDKNALEKAKKNITNGLVGLVVVIVSVFILDLIGYLLGFNIGTGGLLDLPVLFGLIK